MAKTNNNSAINFNVTFGTLRRKNTRGVWEQLDRVPANAAVLLRECKQRVDGETLDAVEFMAVEGVRRSTKDATILPLLALYVADAQVRNGFASDFKIVVVNGSDVETKLTAKSAYTRWLGGNTIHRTNSEGEIKDDVTLDPGLLLRHTSLNVRKTSPLLTAKGDELKELLKTTAKAIAKQANMQSTIIKTAKAMYNAAVDAKAETPETDATETEKVA